MNRKESNKSTKGSILVVCMVLAAVGTLGVAAWISLLDARGHLAEQNIAGMDRRVRYRNGRIMAYHTMIKRHLHSNDGEMSLETYQIPDNWGKITVNSYSEVPLATIAATRNHKIGARPFNAFTTDILVGVSDGSMEYPWQFQLKSYNSILGGELLTILPANEVSSELSTVTGDVLVKGRSVFWGTPYQASTLSVKAEQFLVSDTNAPSLSYKNPNDENVIPVNYPFVKQTSGYVGSEGNYNGQASVISDPNNSHNTYLNRVQNISSFASINGTFVSLLGNQKFANGTGPSSVAPKSVDPILQAKIDDTSLGGNILANEMIASSPLSSAIMISLINRAIPLTESEIRPVISANIPLPDDVVAQLGLDEISYYTRAFKEEIYAANGSSVVCDAVGGITVDLNQSDLPHLILQNFTSIKLNGQPDEIAADLRSGDDPKVIVISNLENVKLDLIELANFNRRRLVLAVKNVGVLDNSGLTDYAGNPNISGTNHTLFRFTSGSPFKDWRMLCEFEGIIADFDLSGVQGLTLTGGLRTNHSLNVSGGTLTIERELNSENFASFLCRTAWVEAFRTTLP